ncbi:hypothetical protein D0T12_02035 [Actinomadura spongiicola]|uniref:Uncharacterized protein n=1 Tax=Actinomadura spongiicola TaxID=2303421 RepID=A0A372GP01_9ACTN|nr:hypothetical protein D0T12_02035 [Actinomadura spongiicola]
MDRVAVRTRQRHTAIQALLDQGRTIKQITAELQVSRNTVRRFARATDPGWVMGSTLVPPGGSCGGGSGWGCVVRWPEAVRGVVGR